MADGRCAFFREPCGSSHGVVASTDGGTTWVQSLDDDVVNVSVLDLAVDPQTSSTVFAGTETGLYRSTDGSTTWTAVGDLPDGVRVWAVAISPADGDTVLAGIEQLGLYASSDGGSSWVNVSTGLEPNSQISDIVFDPTNPQTVYLSDYLSGAYRSSDGGTTWIRINDGLRMRAVLALAISANGQHVYAATSGEGVYRLDLSSLPLFSDGFESGDTTRWSASIP